ncbi:MAG: dimethylsulfonioproprionate lyase family protein [Pseudomonadota bacterium]
MQHFGGRPAGPVAGSVGETSEATQAPDRLWDVPDWGYLLREIYEVYRVMGAGGSELIRAHQRAVREATSRTLAANAPVLARVPESKPVCKHLARALDLGKQGVAGSLVSAIGNVRDRLSWQYGYERVPKGLIDTFGWCEFAGPVGPIETPEVIIGQVLFAPGVIYPAHAHDIAESYVVLTGSISQNDDGVFMPGSMIFNPPGRRHRITVGKRAPALLLYAWHGPRERLAGQKLKFRRA